MDHGKMDIAKILAARLSVNWRQMDYFIAAVIGLAALFILFHLSRQVGHWWLRGRKGPRPFRVLVILSRSALLRKAPLVPSGGHAILIICYATINLSILFTNVGAKPSRASNYGSRAGWLATGNLVLVIFLGLKNTPLALCGWSHDRLNVLHRAAGHATAVMVVVHGASYSAGYAMQGKAPRLAERDEVYGEVAGVALLLAVAAGALVRRWWWYELFYVVHVALWLIAAVTVSLHQPDLAHKMVVAVIVAAAMWALDRVVRAARLLAHSVNNSVTLTPLPGGATRVTVRKPPRGAVPGEHCFLWVRGIRALETHPFTMAALEPLELVVSSHDGFTRDLHAYALANPGATLPASVEGPYGAMPTAGEYDAVLLVAGGTGATFTFGTALHMLKSISPEDNKRIIFIWIMKYEAQLTWFASHLDTLEQDPRVQLRLYVTRSRRQSTDSEKSQIAYEGSVHRQRPDVPHLVRAAIDATPSDQRILVTCCGPDGMMHQVRDTTAACIRSDGPQVELHCQQFGW